MSLELQLSTAKADAALKNIERSIDSLRLSLDRIATGTAGFDSFIGRLASVRGINPQAVQSIRDLGVAASALNGAGSNLAALSNALSHLAALDVTKVSVGVRSMVAALNSVRVPQGLSQLATQLDSIATSSTRAASAMRALSGAAGNLRMPTSAVQQFNTGLSQTSTQSRQASASLAYFGSTASNVRAALTAIGIASIGREFGQFVKGAYEARVTYEKFNAIMNNTTGPNTAGVQWQFLRRVAKETATDINTLAESYPKFATAAKAGGATAQEIGNLFKQSAVFIRGFGLGTEDAKGALLSLTQMMTKGKITAEEMIGQLAERGVPGMNALAMATGKTTGEIQKLMQAGALGRQELALLITELSKMGAGAVEAQLKSIQAAMTQLSNAFVYAKLAFGEGFFQTVAAGVNALAAALSSNVAIMFFQTLGAAAAVASNIVLVAVTSLVTILASATGVFYQVADAANILFQALTQSSLGQFVQWLFEGTAGLFSFQGALQMVGTALGIMLVIGAGYLAWLVAVRVAQLAWLAVTNPGYAAIVGLASGALLASAGFEQLSEKFYEGATAAQEATTKFGEMSGTSEDLVGKLQYTGTAAETAGDGLSNAGISAAAATSKMESLAASNHKTSDAFDDLAVSAMGAAGAINMAANAGGSGGSDFGGGGGGGGGGGWQTNSKWEFGDYAEGRPIDDQFWEQWSIGGMRSGGYSDKPSVSKQTMKAPAIAFATAPHFATGGTTRGMAGVLPDGGIPAVLHKNEAVVPLASGGRIPVALSVGGGSRGSTQGSGDAFARMTTNTDIFAKRISEVNEHTRDVIKVNKDGNRNIIAELQASDSKLGNITAGIGKLNTTMSETNSIFIGSAAKGMFGMRGQDMNFLGGGGSGASGGGSGGSIFIGKAGKGMYGMRNYDPTAVGNGGGSGAGDDSIFTTYAWKGVPGKRRGFATGSPNAFDDVSRAGGASVLIHPDEAIIPLPDGRAVPVDMGGFEPPHSERRGNERDFDSDDVVTSTRGGRPVVVNVSMNINAPDPRAFHASSDQMAQAMARKIERAIKTIGVASSVDDPTITPGRNKT